MVIISKKGIVGTSSKNNWSWFCSGPEEQITLIETRY
jgi:hypothetical protein